MKHNIYAHLPGDFPWQVHWFREVTSTNDIAKDMAKNGSPHGTAVLADHQTGGRGRMGRSFSSHPGGGVYLSVILRPSCPAGELMHLTCAVGTLVCDAAEACTGCRPGLKWVNDLILDGKKLGGILTELSLTNEGFVDFAVVGIGINCNQQPSAFPPELRQSAVSLAMHTGNTVAPEALAAAVLQALYQHDPVAEKPRLMAAYRRDCLTLGRAVNVLGESGSYGATALDIDDSGALLVLLPDGSRQTLRSGEVSIRGTDGYL